VAGFLPVIDGCVEEFRAPEVADRLPVAVKHVQDRLLGAVGGLGQVVKVVGGAGRGQWAQPAPAAFGGEGEDALERRLRGDRGCRAARSSAVSTSPGPFTRSI
jgi:hypothetical protein